MSTDQKQPLFEHIRALRRALLISVAAVGILFVLFFYLCCDQLVDFVLMPVRSRGIAMISTAVSEALMTQLKVCLIAGIVAGMPVIIHQIWSFVSPALYPHEKRLFAGLSTIFRKRSRFASQVMMRGSPKIGYGGSSG